MTKTTTFIILQYIYTHMYTNAHTYRQKIRPYERDREKNKITFNTNAIKHPHTITGYATLFFVFVSLFFVKIK